MEEDGSVPPSGPRRHCRRIAAAAVLALAIGSPAAAEPAPQRVASLNLCADELLLRLLPPERIASVTVLAADPASSTVADRTEGLPLNRGLTEEVVPLAPDLVVTGAYTTRAAAAMLKRLGVPVLELDMPDTLDEVYAQIRTVAARLGVPEKGEAMVAEIRAGIADEPPPGAPRSAVVLRPNGFTAGAGSLSDALMRRAGLDNIAGRIPTDRLGQLSLEDIVTAAPEVLILDIDADSPPSLARNLIQHPALKAGAAKATIVSLPARLWSCPGPQLVEAFARVRAAGRAAVRARPPTAAQLRAPGLQISYP